MNLLIALILLTLPVILLTLLLIFSVSHKKPKEVGNGTINILGFIIGCIFWAIYFLIK
jgi:hypothetical protein